MEGSLIKLKLPAYACARVSESSWYLACKNGLVELDTKSKTKNTVISSTGAHRNISGITFDDHNEELILASPRVDALTMLNIKSGEWRKQRLNHDLATSIRALSYDSKSKRTYALLAAHKDKPVRPW